MTPTEAKERIIKLLRLGRSSNQHEADLALKRALELAQRFAMSLEELNVDQDLEPIAERAFRVGLRLGLEHKLAASTVLNFFGCEVVLGRPHIHFVGTPAGVEIGEYVFVFLVREARKARRGFMRRNPRMGYRGRANFLYGFFSGIASNLRKGRQELIELRPGFDLALANKQQRFKDYCKERWTLVPVARQKFDLNHDAAFDGYRAGKDVIIHKPIAGAAEPLRLTDGGGA